VYKPNTYRDIFTDCNYKIIESPSLKEKVTPVACCEITEEICTEEEEDSECSFSSSASSASSEDDDCSEQLRHSEGSTKI